VTVADLEIDSITPEFVMFAATWKGMLALEHLITQSNLWDQVEAGGTMLTPDDLLQIIQTVRQAQTEYRLAGGLA
jgi:hypothetical protein